MCGLVGIISAKPDAEVGQKMTMKLTHRGPDDSGSFLREGIYLGHRRLSIIDLSACGRQPMLSQDRSVALVFNGEIYNFNELRRELTDYQFASQTDSEVILAAYQKWGEDCFKHFNGMFAIALWDLKSQKLILARDRLGIKPLYYCINADGECLFASEIKSLLMHPSVRIKPNYTVIHDFLAHGLYDHSEETFFDGIKSLPQGTYGILKNGQLLIEKYWHLDEEHCFPSHLSLEEAKERLRELMFSSVRYRLISDVPVGINLSGGLDSSVVLACVNQIRGNKLTTTFGINFKDERFSEYPFMKEVIDHFGNPSIVGEYGVGELEESLETAMNCLEQPFAGISPLSFTKIYKMAKDHGCTVVLEGQGGDEIFAGYLKYLNPEIHNGRAFETQDGTSYTKKQCLNTGFFSPYKRPFHLERPFLSAVKNQQYWDIKYLKLPRVLRFHDELSMLSACELRLPFLDYRVVEFAFSLPDAYKIKDGETKSILRQAFQDRLPAGFTGRKKRSVTTPQTVWFQNELKGFVESVIHSKSFQSREIWNAVAIKAELNKFMADSHPVNSFFIWQWINLELWFRKYID